MGQKPGSEQNPPAGHGGRFIVLNLNRSGLKTLKDYKKETTREYTKVTLNDNQFSQIPLKQLSNLPLVCLEMERNRLVQIPSSIALLTELKYLSLPWNYLQDMTEDIGALTRLARLELQSNQLTRLPNGFSALTNLVTVDLSSNLLCDVTALPNLAQTKQLRLHHNQLASLPSHFGKSFASLQGLYMQHNFLTRLVDNFSCPLMERIFLSFNRLRSLPLSLCNSPKLKVFVASHNALGALPENLSSLISLNHLELPFNRIMRLPASIGGLSSLLVLDLRNNALRGLPDEIRHLTRLEKLNLANNALDELPEAIGGLLRLKELNVTRNQLKKLPDELFQLTIMEKLTISDNYLIAIPSGIGNLRKLASLNCVFNALKEIPDDIIDKFVEHGSLHDLNLCSNCLSEVPAVSNLTSLRKLYLGYNKIMEFTQKVDKLFFLREVNLSGNKLRELPDVLFELPQLESLWAPSNKIVSIPPGISRLTKLSTLFLGHNRIKEIPPELGCLTLEELDLSHNDIAIIPSSLCKMTSLTILDISANSKLSEISLDIAQMAKLRHLKLHFCNLRTMPFFSDGLSGLAWLTLFGNPIEHLSQRYESIVDVTPGIYASQSVSKSPVSKAQGSTISVSTKPLKKVLKCYVSEMKGIRPTMEDTMTISDLDIDGVQFYAVFDGHKDSKAAEFCATRFHKKLRKILCNDSGDVPLKAQFTKKDIYKGLKRTCEELTQDLFEHKIESGCTAVFCMIYMERLWLAHVGDARGVVSVKGKADVCTMDHKPYNANERLRIQRLGGYISTSERVYPRLDTSSMENLQGIAVARAIGDKDFTPFISSEPTIISKKLTSSDEFIILACDGLWDVVSNQTAVDLVREYRKAKGSYASCASMLRDIAYMLGSTDNITCMVIDLK